MARALLITLAAFALASCAPGDRPDALAAEGAVEPRVPVDRPLRRPFQRGVCWVGGAHDPSMLYLAKLGADWVSVTPFGYGQQRANRPPPRGYAHSTFRGESVAGVREIVRSAHRAGLRVIVKPHLWFFRRDGEWRGSIAMTSEEDWVTWFRMYGEFLLPFVEMAKEEQVAVFCIGTELSATIGREQDWRGIIAEIRARYDGELTYSSNWYDEYQRVGFWDALDYIGVQAYFPLADRTGLTSDEIAAAWEPWKERMRKLSARVERPVLYTEFGYRPVAEAVIQPWLWQGGTPDDQAQVRAYTGAFRAHEGEDWLAGLYVWKWFSPYTGADGGRPRRRRAHDGFSPQGRPAEATLSEWFREQPGTADDEQPRRVPVPASRVGANVVGVRLPLDSLRWVQPQGPVTTAGKITLVRWWTSGCPFCERSLPTLTRLAAEYAERGLQTVAVYHPKPPRDVTGEWVKEVAATNMSYTGPIAIDDDWRLLRDFYLDRKRPGTSVTFVLDDRGVVRFVHPGPELRPGKGEKEAGIERDHRTLLQAVDALLAELAARREEPGPDGEKNKPEGNQRP